MEDKTLRVIDEQGNEVDYEIVLTFKSDQTKKSYVVYKEPGDSDEVYAASYDETETDGGNLNPIETDEEWDIIEEVLDTFQQEEETK
jgi:uncharacterized protein YrzB (UPF0473 family)